MRVRGGTTRTASQRSGGLNGRHAPILVLSERSAKKLVEQRPERLVRSMHPFEKPGTGQRRQTVVHEEGVDPRAIYDYITFS